MTSILTAELRDLLDAYGYLENMITVYERDPGILLAGSGECAKKNVVIGAAKEALNQIAQIFVGYDFKVKRSVDGKIVESGTGINFIDLKAEKKHKVFARILVKLKPRFGIIGGKGTEYDECLAKVAGAFPVSNELCVEIKKIKENLGRKIVKVQSKSSIYYQKNLIPFLSRQGKTPVIGGLYQLARAHPKRFQAIITFGRWFKYLAITALVVFVVANGYYGIADHLAHASSFTSWLHFLRPALLHDHSALYNWISHLFS
jgi:hypothetical protein